MSIFDWIWKLLSLGRGILSLIGCVVFCLILISLKSEGRQTFHDVMVSTFLYPADRALAVVNRSVHVFSEHEELKSENARLRVENDLLKQAIVAFPRVNVQQIWADSSGLKLRKAEVVAEQPSRFATSWVINLGSSDSVGMNMPVITSRGVVGKVVKTYASHSLVQLINDPNFKLSVVVNRTRARGLLEFWKSGTLVARFPAGSELAVGDTLMTSGLGGVFPKGLAVGMVSAPPHADPDQGEILVQAEVQSFENPNRVEEAFVLLREASFKVENP